MEWMRFDPVKFGLLVDGESLETEGAFMRMVRHLWNRGPLPEAEVQRICKGSFDVVRSAMLEFDGGLSLQLVEDAREHGLRRVAQRVEAGKSSASKRNQQPTTVERPLNDRSADVLSISMSKSSSESKSTQERKERATPKAKVEAVPPDDIADHWRQWMEHRSELRHPMTLRAQQMKLKHLTAMGCDRARNAIEHSIANGWKGIFEPQQLTNGATAPRRTGNNQSHEDYARDVAIATAERLRARAENAL